MKELKEYIRALNQEARTQGYADGFQAYLVLSKRSGAEYFAAINRLDARFSAYSQELPKKRKRYLAKTQSAADILKACGISTEGLEVEFVDGLKAPYTDVLKRKIFLSVQNGCVDLKSFAHEAGHLSQIIETNGEIAPIASEERAVEYELRLMKKLCESNSAEFKSYTLDRVYTQLALSEAKRAFFESGEFSKAALRFIELKNKYDIFNRWSTGLAAMRTGFSEVNLLLAFDKLIAAADIGIGESASKPKQGAAKRKSASSKAKAQDKKQPKQGAAKSSKARQPKPKE